MSFCDCHPDSPDGTMFVVFSITMNCRANYPLDNPVAICSHRSSAEAVVADMERKDYLARYEIREHVIKVNFPRCGIDCTPEEWRLDLSVDLSAEVVGESVA